MIGERRAGGVMIHHNEDEKLTVVWMGRDAGDDREKKHGQDSEHLRFLHKKKNIV